MSIKTKATYGDYYWASSVEASLQAQMDAGEDTKVYIPNIFDDPELVEKLPFDFYDKWTALLESPAPALAGVGMRFVSEMADTILGQTMTHAMKDFNYYVASKFADNRLTFEHANTLYFRNKMGDDFYLSRAGDNGWKAEEASFAYEASKPYPDIRDVMLWARYHGDPDNIREKVWEKLDVSVDDIDLWEWLTLQRRSTEQLNSLYRRTNITQDDYDYAMIQIGWQSGDLDSIRDLVYDIPASMLLVQGNLQQGIEDDTILGNIAIGGVHPDYAQTYLDGILTKPATQDIISYQLRKDPTLSDLPQSLRKIGIHPDYYDIYKTLAYQIPPVADIITMAVREAFTPAIAAKFGQYEDFPDDLATYAGMKGLSPEWASRYWAAHWSLPSPQQGFEMLHRGIINKSELDMLLRALDIMPFWRDKLTQVAYRPLTRVDVRRMYQEGVLDEQGVFSAYLDHGYSPDNAKNMTEFTVIYVLSRQAGFTTKDITNAFAQRMIDSSEAKYLLTQMGVKSEDASYIISRAEYKRAWEYKENRIAAIKNLYRKKQYDNNKTRSELLKLDLPTEQVDVLMETWWFETEGQPSDTWTKAETLKFIKSGWITPERGQLELQRIGFDLEHIDIYMKSIA